MGIHERSRRARLNFALAFAAGHVPGGLSEATREAIDAEIAADLTPTRVAGLLLGSPEFQRR